LFDHSPYSHELRVTTTCLPTLRTDWDHIALTVMRKCRNMVELVGGRLLWHRHIKLSPDMACASGDYIEKQLKCTHFLYIIKNCFPIASFVNSWRELTLWISLAFNTLCNCARQKPHIFLQYHEICTMSSHLLWPKATIQTFWKINPISI
jgi:hypothetical protein